MPWRNTCYASPHGMHSLPCEIVTDTKVKVQIPRSKIQIPTCETPLYSDEEGNEIGKFKSNGQFTLWGITSVGGNSENACSGVGSRSKPGIYTKVVNYMDWIAKQFKINHVDPNA